MRQGFLLLDFEDASADSLKCMLMSCTLQPLYLTSEEVCVGRVQYNMSGVHLCSRICAMVCVWQSPPGSYIHVCVVSYLVPWLFLLFWAQCTHAQLILFYSNLTSLMWEKLPGLSCSSVLQAMDDWLGPENEATHCCSSSFVAISNTVPLVPQGRKLISFLFGMHPKFVEDLHQTIKNQIPHCPKYVDTDCCSTCN